MVVDWEKFMGRVWLGALLLASLTANAQWSAPFTLVCHYRYPEGPRNQDLIFSIDPDLSTVNGRPAKIDDASIAFPYDTPSLRVDISIDRRTGGTTLNTWDTRNGQQVGPVPGTCTRIARKF